MDNKNQIFAAVSPTSGALMHAGRHSDILDAISTYVRDVPASSPSIAMEIVWYEFPAGTDLDVVSWDSDMTDQQWDQWEEADPSLVPGHKISSAVEVLENDQLSTFVIGTPRAQGFKIPEPPADI